MATERACLLIADISGYTGYLAGVELDHAQDILADLMCTIVSGLRPGFRLAKLEGDAAFTYAVTDAIDGSLLLDRISLSAAGDPASTGLHGAMPRWQVSSRRCRT